MLRVAFNQHFSFQLSGTFHLVKHYSFCAIYWQYSVLLFSPAGVCFWLCIACHEIWATQNVSTYIVTAYDLCSLYAGGWVPEQWLTVSLYTAPPCVRISEHIWEVSGNCSLKIQIQLSVFQTQTHFSESQSRLTFLNLNPDSLFWISILLGNLCRMRLSSSFPIFNFTDLSHFSLLTKPSTT